MPNLADHILQARHNEEFYQVTDKNAFSDWAMTAIFYAALHYIDALLASLGTVDPGSHSVRDDQVHKRAELRPIANSYFRLKNRSRNARYCCMSFRPEELQRCFDVELASIRRHIMPIVNS